jgi:AcrR family transcriptional regulator
VHGRLLDAATALFDERGVGSVTVGEICARADVADKTFFNHFGSKRDLVRELADQALARLLADLEAARKHPGPTSDRLRVFFSRIAGNLEEAGPMHRELVTEIIHAAHEARTGTRQARVLHEAFGELVADGVAAGDVTGAHDPATLTEMILGAFYALVFDWAHLPDYPLRRRALAAARFLGDALGAARGKRGRRR